MTQFIKNFKSKILVLLSTFYFLLSKPASARLIPGSRTGSQGLPPGQPITLDVLDYLIFRVSTFFISVSGVLALIFIIWSGVSYMYAGDDTEKVKTAQARLKSGIIGAAIIFGVGVIIQTIASVVTLDFFCSQKMFGRLGGPCIW